MSCRFHLLFLPNCLPNCSRLSVSVIGWITSVTNSSIESNIQKQTCEQQLNKQLQLFVPNSNFVLEQNSLQMFNIKAYWVYKKYLKFSNLTKPTTHKFYLSATVSAVQFCIRISPFFLHLIES